MFKNLKTLHITLEAHGVQKKNRADFVLALLTTTQGCISDISTETATRLRDSLVHLGLIVDLKEYTSGGVMEGYAYLNVYLIKEK